MGRGSGEDTSEDWRSSHATISASETTSAGSDNRCPRFQYKKPVRAATWNLRHGINQPLYLERAILAAQRLSVDVLCIAEAQKPGSGRQDFANGWALLWTGPQPSGAPGPSTPGRRSRGVALLLSPRAAATLQSYTVVSDRIIVASFTWLAHYTLDVIGRYAPTSGASAAAREAFRALLRAARQAIPSKHFLLELGDANALVGYAAPGTPNFGGAIGRHGVGRRNAAGTTFADDCEAETLCVANTFFRHKAIQKNTHKHCTGGRQGHGATPKFEYLCNDLVVVRRSMLSTVRDVCVKRGVNGGGKFSTSDHHLVLVTLQLKLRAIPKKKPRPDFRRLATDPKLREAFAQRLETLVGASPPREDRGAEWDRLSSVVDQAATEVLPAVVPPTANRPYPSSQLLADLEAERQATRDGPPSPARTSALTRISNRIRKERRRLQKVYGWAVGRQAWHAARHGDPGACWAVINEHFPKGGSARPSGPQKLTAADGALLLTPEDQAAHLAAHYDDLLNGGTGADPAAVAALPLTAQRDCAPLTAEEVDDGLRLLRNGKARGPNGITNEQLKYTGPAFRAALTALLEAVWAEGLPPSSKEATLLSLPKKGDTTLARNHRGIQVGDKLYLLVSRIAATRLNPICEEILDDSQAGFRRGRGCRDHRFTLQLLLENAREWHHPVYLAFVDLEKAFDRVDRDALVALVERHGVGEDLVRVVEDLHRSTTAKVRWRGATSEAFEVSWGVQQGSPASNPLWNIVADAIKRQTLEELGFDAGVRIFSRSGRPSLHSPANLPADAASIRLLLLLLADDITVCTDTAEALAQALHVLEAVCLRWGMRVSVAKTKLMRAGPGADPVVSLGGSQLEVVPTVKYLGSWFASDGSMDREITARRGAAIGAARRLGDLWDNKKIPRGFKLMFYKTAVLTILLYGAESWSLTKAQTDRLEAFHQRQLRIILGVKWDDYVRNVAVLKRAGVPSICDTLRLRRMDWLGHVVRLPEGRVLRRLLFGRLDGQRGQGKQRQSLQRVYLADIAYLNGGVPTGLSWARLAEDPAAWRKYICSRAGPAELATMLEMAPIATAPAPHATDSAVESAAQGPGLSGASPSTAAAGAGPAGAEQSSAHVPHAPDTADSAAGQEPEVPGAPAAAAAAATGARPSVARQSPRVTRRMAAAAAARGRHSPRITRRMAAAEAEAAAAAAAGAGAAATGAGHSSTHTPHAPDAADTATGPGLGQLGGPAAVSAAAGAGPPGVRQSPRITRRMGQTPTEPLSPPLTSASGKPRRTPVGPYTGAPRGRRPGTGKHQIRRRKAEERRVRREAAEAAARQ